MSPRGLVSVVIIFLNEQRFLEESIQSVFDQTYDDWELLLVDDGSNDESSTIARNYASRYPERIRYLEHPEHENRGMSASRNLGLEHACGEFVALLDADDVWLPHKLEHQVRILTRNPDVAMVFGPALAWYSWDPESEPSEDDFLTKLPSGSRRVPDGWKVLARILLRLAAPVHTTSSLIRRQAARDAGGFENQFRSYYEDQAFFAKVLLGHRVYAMQECLDKYRQHPDSHCAAVLHEDGIVSMPMLKARLHFLGWLDSLLAGMNVNWVLKLLVKHELWIHRRPALARTRHRLVRALRATFGQLVTVTFAVGRVVIPMPIRHRVWRMIAGPEIANDSITSSGDDT